ncbi:hypothetical protein [Flexistipes sinusarabici]|uniref:hypothetical protein n=1 Tax=Flexistipes sinusarabici TaxID=2352 RepID=UPI0002DA6F80|nr:hypothetical protein [Flexistipes sinusarabici]
MPDWWLSISGQVAQFDPEYSVTSTSASKCKQALESVVMGDENTVLMNSFIKDLYKNLFLAVSDFLSSRNLPDKSVEITQAVKKSLNSEQI